MQKSKSNSIPTIDAQEIKSPEFHGVPVYDVLKLMDMALNKGRRVEILLDKDGKAIVQSVERKRLKIE